MVSYAVVSERGDREINEDYIGYKVTADANCFVLADGLGGHGHGEVASRLVVEKAIRNFEKEGLNTDFVGETFEKCQKELMRNQIELQVTDEMKTTMVMCCINEDSIRWGHIGDSRLYLFNRKKIVCRTIDHSVPQLLVFAGEIRDKDIRFHPDRNRLMKVMGTEWNKPEYELSDVVDRTGEQALLMCSDGFWELIEEKKMLKCLNKASNVNEWLDMMLEIVCKNGIGKNMDNYSAICIWC